MNKKSAILFSALFLSVAIAGVAYAHWLEIITIDGFVQTGTLDLETSLEINFEQEKPVAKVKAGAWKDNVEMNFLNVYPCFSATGRITLENVGTIPAGLEEVRLTVWEDDGNFVWEDRTATQGTYGLPVTYQYFLVLVNEDVSDPLMNEALQLGVNFGATDHTYYDPQDYPNANPNSIFQIDDGQSAWMDFYIHFDEGIPEDADIWFNAEVEYWNWNEAAEEAFNCVYNVVDGPRPTPP